MDLSLGLPGRVSNWPQCVTVKINWPLVCKCYHQKQWMVSDVNFMALIWTFCVLPYTFIALAIWRYGDLFTWSMLYFPRMNQLFIVPHKHRWTYTSITLQCTCSYQAKILKLEIFSLQVFHLLEIMALIYTVFIWQ